jgi:hypothetical protein
MGESGLGGTRFAAIQLIVRTQGSTKVAFGKPST